MNRRVVLAIAFFILCVAIILSAGFWYLFLDIPTVRASELDAKPPYPPDSAPESYVLVANASSRELTNVSDWSQWETMVRYNGATDEKFGRLTSSTPRRNISIEVYHRYVGNGTEMYSRYRSSKTAEFEARISHIRDDLDPQTEKLLVENQTQTYYHYEWNSENRELGMRTVRLSSALLPPYERAGTTSIDGQEVARYVPVNGWVDMTGSTDTAPEAYVSHTAGSVYVARSTDRIVRANISFVSKRTEMRVGRWFGEAGTRANISLTLDRSIEISNIQPEWVADLDFRIPNMTR